MTEEKNEVIKESFKEQEKKRQEREQAKFEQTKRIPNEQNRMIDTQKR
ncbi:hypothetical protein [Fictibacillus phosphorivorans]|nr:hypothetical protein [Fictibacillus phosphorivorans]MCM3718225.1 hypothetical protein [Fictibacillus phosphorivorans]MCM3775908.1 hypothetical protein [Fictibacillus phosphorivorans]